MNMSYLAFLGEFLVMYCMTSAANSFATARQHLFIVALLVTSETLSYNRR